jgi:hypothetical protein
MLNCFNATRLMSDSRERPLRRREKIALKLHKMMCSGCRNFGNHLTVLHQVSQDYVKRDDIPDEKPASPHSHR